MSPDVWERYLKEQRREQMRLTLRCLVLPLTMVGLAFVLSAAI